MRPRFTFSTGFATAAKRDKPSRQDRVQASQVSHTFNRGLLNVRTPISIVIITTLSLLSLWFNRLSPTFCQEGIWALARTCEGGVKRDLPKQAFMEGIDVMASPLCFDCAYFVPEGMTHNDLEPDQWDEGMAGDCRRRCPIAGKPADDDRRVNYAYWPIVLAGDWCGGFRSKAAQHEAVG